MGKNNKKGPKANVFKVAGAKSLKKTKAKAVNLGLKKINQKVADLDKQLVEIKSNPQVKTPVKEVKGPQKKTAKPITNEEVAKTTEQVDKMDL